MRLFALLLAVLALPASAAFAQSPSPAYWQGTQTSGDGAMFLNSGKGVTLQDSSNTSVVFPKGIQLTGPTAFSGTKAATNSSLWVAPSGTVTGSCSQTGPGNDTWCDLNRIAVTEQINSINGRSIPALNIVHNFGGGATSGQFNGLVVLTQQTGAVSSANNPGMVGASFIVNANGSMGGAVGSESGNVWGINTNAVLAASATNFKAIIGNETDLAIVSPGGALNLDGIEFVLTSSHTAAASQENSGMVVVAGGKTTSNGGTIPGLTIGYAFGGNSGYNPMDASGTLIGVFCHTNNCASFPPGTVAHGIDISAYSFSADAFKSPGFVVDGSGKVTANSITTTTSGPVTAGNVYSSLNNSQYGSNSCASQMYLIFAHTRGFYALNGACATNDASTPNGDQFIQGLYSVVDQGSSNASAIPLVAQGIAEANGKAEYGINTVHQDTYNAGESSAASITGTVMTVGGTVYGAFGVGDWLYGTGVAAGTQISSLGTGTGGAGTYNVNISQTVASTTITDHPVFSGVILQDEIDFFAYQADTKSRLLIDGIFPNGAASGANLRNGVAVGLFSGSAGHWQNGYQAANGCCDVALKLGDTVVTPQVVSLLSQTLNFDYTDNTNATQREIILTADPTNAGLTGADLTLTSSYVGAANLSLPSGSFKVGGKNVVSSAGAAVHTMLTGRNGSITQNATTCGVVVGSFGVTTCSSTDWMLTNQAGQFSTLYAKALATPTGSDTISVTLMYNSAPTALTCTITSASPNCTDTTDKVTVAAVGTYYLQFVSSATAPANTAVITAINFDNPAP